MTTGVFRSSVFKPTVFKTANYIPPTPNNFDTHDGFSKKEHDNFLEQQRKLGKIESDKRAAKKINKATRLQSIKDIVEPKPIVAPIKEVIKQPTPKPSVKIKPVPKKVVIGPIAPVEPIKPINYELRRDLLDKIADKRYVLSLMKIVHGLDDYEVDDKEYNETHHEDDLTKTLEILNQNYKTLKDLL